MDDVSNFTKINLQVRSKRQKCFLFLTMMRTTVNLRSRCVLVRLEETLWAFMVGYLIRPVKRS